MRNCSNQNRTLNVQKVELDAFSPNAFTNWKPGKGSEQKRDKLRPQRTMNTLTVRFFFTLDGEQWTPFLYSIEFRNINTYGTSYATVL